MSKRDAYPEFAAFVDGLRAIDPECVLAKVEYIDTGKSWTNPNPPLTYTLAVQASAGPRPKGRP